MKKYLILLMCTFALTAFAAEEKNARTLVAEIHQAPLGLIQVLDGEGAPILLVHGLNPTPEQEEWIQPISMLKDLKRNVYFHKWDKFKSLTENHEHLRDSVKSILDTFPDDELTLIGYSAGGVISLLMMDQLQGTELETRIKLHTIASPIFGYNAPAIARVAENFIGKTTIGIGRGAFKKLKHQTLNSCKHWINTDCDLDRHACINKKNYSALYKSGSLPCGEENTVFFSDQSHTSVIEAVIKLLLISEVPEASSLKLQE